MEASGRPKAHLLMAFLNGCEDANKPTKAVSHLFLGVR